MIGVSRVWAVDEREGGFLFFFGQGGNSGGGVGRKRNFGWEGVEEGEESVEFVFFLVVGEGRGQSKVCLPWQSPLDGRIDIPWTVCASDDDDSTACSREETVPKLHKLRFHVPIHLMIST